MYSAKKTTIELRATNQQTQTDWTILGMTAREKSSEAIARALRERICLANPEETETLHEGRLGLEFGVSRTPIRQALQHLAYEGLVSVKSGVGTVVIPLDPDGKTRDVAITCALLRAAAEVVPNKVRADFTECLNQVSATNQPSRAMVFNVRSQVLETFSSMIESTIPRDAFRASYWRLIRWRMNDLEVAPTMAQHRLKFTLEEVLATSKSGNVTDLLIAAAAQGQEELTPTNA